MAIADDRILVDSKVSERFVRSSDGGAVVITGSRWPVNNQLAETLKCRRSYDVCGQRGSSCWTVNIGLILSINSQLHRFDRYRYLRKSTGIAFVYGQQRRLALTAISWRKSRVESESQAFGEL